MAYDGLTDPFDHIAMGESTERYNAHLGISREEQDAFAARSHQRAAVARKDGLFDDEIVAVPVPQRRGEPVMVTQDEGIREDTTIESLARLAPGVLTRRHHYCGQCVADLRRCVRGAGHVKRECRTARMADPRGDRCARGGRRARQLAALTTFARDRARPRPRTTRARRDRSVRDQRGVRGGGDPVDARARHRPERGQRQRRRDRTRSPDRDVRCTSRSASDLRTSPARWRHRRGRTLWWRRAG